MGAWLAQPAHAERVAAEGATAATAVLNALSDDDVRDVIEDLAREHVLAPEWGPSIGGWLERVVESDPHTSAADLAADSLGSWLAANPDLSAGLVSRPLPARPPRIAHRRSPDTVTRPALAFAASVPDATPHPARPPPT